MSNLSEMKTERLIKEVVVEIIESPSPPPIDESWARLEMKLKHHCDNSQKDITDKHSILKLAVPLGVVIILCLSLSISFPERARAVGNRIFNTFSNLIGGTLMNERISYQQEGSEKTIDDIKEVSVGEELVVSLEEARSVCPFLIVTPQYLPANYKLLEVKYHEILKPSTVVKVTLNYYCPDSSNITITEKKSSGDYGAGQGYDIEDAKTSDFTAGYNRGKLITFKNGNIKATWLKQDIIYELESRIPEKEALKIIESI